MYKEKSFKNVQNLNPNERKTNLFIKKVYDMNLVSFKKIFSFRTKSLIIFWLKLLKLCNAAK